MEGAGGGVLVGEVKEDFLEEGHFSSGLRKPHRYQGVVAGAKARRGRNQLGLLQVGEEEAHA